VLDRQPAGVELEGATSEGVADSYRSSQGQRSTGYGTGRALRARPRIPADVSPPERRAAFNLLNMMRFQEAYQKKNGRYGSFKETLPISVPSGNSLQNAGYKFELTVESDGFKIVATPTNLAGLRPLLGDDSGFVRFADE